MKCPKCGIDNTDNWPITVDGEIKLHGCTECWEAECFEKWWKVIEKIYKEKK